VDKETIELGPLWRDGWAPDRTQVAHTLSPGFLQRGVEMRLVRVCFVRNSSIWR
jgi:hypothetical protein